MEQPNPNNVYYWNQPLPQPEKETPKRTWKWKLWFHSRKLWFYTGKIFSIIPNPFPVFFKWLIRKLYFKYCFNDSELIEEFVIHFIPDDLRGQNPHFFIQKVQSEASKSSWEARLEILPSGNSISYIRKVSYE